MVKIAAAALTALFISASTLAHAQGPGPAQDLSPADLKAFTEMRIDLVKTALQLTPEQAKLWPAVEEAVRARTTARQQRLANLAARMNEARERSPLELLSERADALTQRGASLKKYVEAWRPLFQTLDDGQKVRLRFAAAYLMHELRDAVANRLSQYADDDESDW
jgi:zinc resistance-associated protein